MRVSRVALISLLLPALAAAQSLTGARRPGIDVLHYTFDVTIPAGMPDTVHFTATATAHRTAAAATLALDLVAAMVVDRVTVNGAAAAFTHPGDQVAITLPAGGPGDTLTVAVTYHGIPTDGLVVRRDSASGTWTAFGDNFPDRARQWLAVVDHPSDKATVEWNVLAPATHRVIGNGALLEETPEQVRGVAMRRTRWRTVQPVYASVMVIGVAPFAVYELGNTACNLAELPGCVAQSVWITPDVRNYMPGPFAHAGDIVAYFSQLAGPFPYEKLAHVQSSTRYGGMENASAIFYADGIYRQHQMSEGLIAHETAHQWFGDAVTTREWPHVWLSEGFATYFAALWTARSRGDSAFRAELRAMRDDVMKAAITTQKPVVDEQLDDLRRVLSSNVYQRAGFVLHMLRQEVGDSAFFHGIRSYYAKYRHGNALTDDFRREVEAASGTSLGWFFDQWMHRAGLPQLTVSWLWDARQRSVILTATQESAGAPYQLNLAVDVTDQGGATQRVRVTVPAGRVATLHLPVKLSGAPAKVAFDPDVSLLGRVIEK